MYGLLKSANHETDLLIRCGSTRGMGVSGQWSRAIKVAVALAVNFVYWSSKIPVFLH